MSSVEVLRKTLDEIEAVVWATCEFGSLGREKMNVLLYKFSAFQAEYDKQVHLSRKELSEDKEWYENCLKTCSKRPASRPICEDRLEKLKELLEASNSQDKQTSNSQTKEISK